MLRAKVYNYEETVNVIVDVVMLAFLYQSIRL